jgi:hypothetical protein
MTPPHRILGGRQTEPCVGGESGNRYLYILIIYTSGERGGVLSGGVFA